MMDCANRLHHGFNPRPARRPGAAEAQNVSAIADALFQSSPSPKAGRCTASRPGPEYRVSILAQPEGRALRARGAWPVLPRTGSGFNPRPSPKAGRYGAVGKLR